MRLFETIKETVTVGQAAEYYGMKIGRNNMICCPFHNDHHPSMKLNTTYYYCFGCGATGDVVQFVADLFGLSNYEAAKKIAVDFGITPDKPPVIAALKKPEYMENKNRRVIEALITATPEFFKGKKKSEIRAYFQTALEFIEKYQDSKTILSAVVHMDEKTPHMHLSFVPITQDGRLCAKEILGNKKKLTWWQDEFWKHMVEKYPDLERGEVASMTGREHIPPRLFKEAAHLTRQAKQITDLLENTNFFNAGKNTDKAVELLQKFFPAMENFQTQVRKYDKTISSLKSDNVSLKRQTQDLSRQVKEATSSSIRKKMNDARLRADYENLQNLMNRIPPEILELAKRGQLTHSDRER